MPTPLSYPVIFLPGIMGTALRDQYPVDPEAVWSVLDAVFKDYERITLHPTDRRYELREPARVVADQVFHLVYAEFIEELRHNLTSAADQPVPVFPFAYDWRQPLEAIQEQLKPFIDEVIARTKLLRHYYNCGFGTLTFPAKVNLAAHSMGGLIIAGYLQKYGQEKVSRIVTIATPFRGSLEAVAKTALGTAKLGIDGGGSREREAARITPSLYYLLPSFTGAVTTEEQLSTDLFDPDSWQPSVLQTLGEFIRLNDVDPSSPQEKARSLLNQMLADAKTHHKQVESLSLDQSKDWLSIIGVGRETRLTMQIGRGPEGNPRFILSDQDVQDEWTNEQSSVKTGDNTVPYPGARAAFLPTEQVICVSPDDFGFWELKDRLLSRFGLHASLPNMNLVQRLAASHFKGRPQGDIWGRAAPDLSPNSPWDPPIPNLPRK